MCVIVYKPKGQVFSDQDFEKCWKRNAHGLGFAANVNGELVSCKGYMSLKDSIKKTKKFRNKEHEGVFHFRIQSTGGVSPGLTHPFDFSRGKEKRLLFHNGTIRQINPIRPESDSQSFAERILVNLETPTVYKVLEALCPPNKFVTVVENNGIEIKLFENHESKWLGGLWYSNLHHIGHTGGPVNIGDGFYFYE